jgi:hypothetical protein
MTPAASILDRLLGLPVLRQPLCFGDLRGRHSGDDDVTVRDGHLMVPIFI